MSNRMKKMAVGALLVSSMMSNAMSVKERARMFEQQQADQREMQQVGRLEKKLGYVSNSGAVTADFARQRVLNQLRPAINDIEVREGGDTARDVVGFVARNKQRAQRGESQLNPLAAHKPHVIYLLNTLEGLPLDEQVEILNILQTELALKAAQAVLEV